MAKFSGVKRPHEPKACVVDGKLFAAESGIKHRK